MSIVCPNKNTNEWKALVTRYGETNAMLAFIRNGEEIPNIEDAESLLSGKNKYKSESFINPHKEVTFQLKDQEIKFKLSDIQLDYDVEASESNESLLTVNAKVGDVTIGKIILTEARYNGKNGYAIGWSYLSTGNKFNKDESNILSYILSLLKSFFVKPLKTTSVNAGKGVGTYIYTKLGEQLKDTGLLLFSDDKRSESAEALWKKLEKNGYAKYLPDDDRYEYIGEPIKEFGAVHASQSEDIYNSWVNLPYKEIQGGIWKQYSSTDYNKAFEEYIKASKVFGDLVSDLTVMYSQKLKKHVRTFVIKRPERPIVKNKEESKSLYDLLLDEVIDPYYLENYFSPDGGFVPLEITLHRLLIESRLDGKDTRYPRKYKHIIEVLNANQSKLKGLKFNLVFDDNTQTLASFNVHTGVITYNVKHILNSLKSKKELEDKKEFLDYLFLHEITHAFTTSAVANPQNKEEIELQKQIKKLYSLAKAQLSINEDSAFDMYGLKDEYEFMSEVLSNSEFREKVSTLKYNILQRIYNAIVNFFKSYLPLNIAEDSILKFIKESPEIRIVDTTVQTEKQALQGQTEREESFFEEIKVESSLSDTVNNIEILKKRAIKVLEDKLNFSLKSGKVSSTSKKEAYDILEKLKESQAAESITLFVSIAYDQIKKIHNEFVNASKEELENPQDKRITLKQLQRWRDSISYYDILNDVLYFLRSEEALKYFTKDEITNLLKYAQYGVGNKDFVKQLYITKGVDQLVDYLLPFYKKAKVDFIREIVKKDYNDLPQSEKDKISLQDYIYERVDKNKTVIEAKAKSDLKSELFRTKGDIGGFGAVVESALDSRDIITMTLAKAIAYSDYQVQQKTAEAHDRMVEAAKLIEKIKDKSMFANTRELYDFMIDEIKLDEERTEFHIVDKFGGEFWNAYHKEEESLKKSEITEDGKTRLLTVREQSSLKYKWLDENAPINNVAFINGLWKYGIELKNKGILTDSNLQSVLTTASDSKFRGFLDLYEVGEISYEAYEELHEWQIRNKYTFREPSKKWKDRNKKWESLQKHIEAKDEIGQFYEAITKISAQANYMLPPGFRIWGRLPGIIKTTSERIGSGQSALSSLKERAKESLDITVNDTDRGRGTYTDATGRIRNFVPVYFTSTLDTKDQSFDLPSLYFKFYEMAVNYKEKSKIIPEVELAKKMIEERDVVVSNKKKKVIDLQTGNVNEVIEDVVKKGIESNIIKQVSDFINMAVYGVHKKDAGRVLGMDVNKIVDKITSYTSITLLAGNLVQGTSNVILGETLQAIEAFAGKEFINPTSFNKAHWFYTKNIGAIADDSVSRSPKNLISILNRKFNVMNEPVENNITDATFWQRNLNTSALFFIQHAGEHYMQSRFMLAMLDMIPAYTVKGEKAGTLLDNLVAKNGEIVLKDGIDPIKSQWTKEDQFEFYYKLKGVLSRLHGEYSEIGKSSLQLLALGRLAIHFRKFIVPGFKRRWDSERFNARLGDYTEGMYISFGKFFGKLFKETKAFTFHYGAMWDTLSDHQKANVGRTTMELTFFLSMWALSAALMSLEGGDDDEWIVDFIAYQSFRFKAELGFYWNVGEAMKILRSPMASMSTLESFSKLMYQLTFDPTEVYQRGPWKGHLKLEKFTYDMLPVVRSMYKLRDVEDQLSYFSR